MRVLASGEGEFRKYKKLLQEKFVLLNVYCRSVKEEHDPRGPEGPYQFTDRSVPVLVFKRWDGKTLIQQLGFQSDTEAATKSLVRFVDKALKENGPVVPPKALRPLLKGFAKAEGHLEKKRIAAAVRELLKVVKAGANEKKFPETPDVAKQAQAKLDALLKEANEALEQAAVMEPDARKKELLRIRREYGALGDVKARVKTALEELKK